MEARVRAYICTYILKQTRSTCKYSYKEKVAGHWVL